MLLKVLLRYSVDKPSIVRWFELNKTVLQKIIVGLRTINDSGSFIFRLEDKNKLELSFNSTQEDGNIIFCNIPIHLFINDDLKYFSQMIGREGMSSNWCMWCKYHSNDWKELLSIPASELWSIGQQHQFVERINSGELKEPKDKKGFVSSP